MCPESPCGQARAASRPGAPQPSAVRGPSSSFSCLLKIVLALYFSSTEAFNFNKSMQGSLFTQIPNAYGNFLKTPVTLHLILLILI